MRTLILVLSFMTAVLGCWRQADAQTYTPNYVYEIPAINSGNCTTLQAIECLNLSGYNYIRADGYYTQFDGGGGYFVSGPAGCTTNGGTIVKDGAGHCYYRATPPTDVHQWGAKCDVQAITNYSGSPVLWTNAAGSNPAFLYVATSTLKVAPQPGQFIAVTQIGPIGPSTTVTTPPVWADRWSALVNKGTSYHIGDLIAFAGYSTPGAFTQQLSIVVDQLGTTAANPALTSGPIYKWHFVSGGQYTSLPDLAPDGGLVQDSAHSCIHSGGGCATSGFDHSATFAAEWSGWSVMDTGTTIANAGSVAQGGQISLDVSGGTVNQSHYPKILVTAVVGGGSTGALAAYQWLDYGSYSTIPSGATVLAQTGCTGSTCVTLTPEWTRGSLATTIANVFYSGSMGCPGTAGSNTYTCIQPTDVPLGVQSGQTIEGFYYGDDDGKFINKALINNPNGASVRVTGFCGTTQSINLPDNSGSVTSSNPSLVGDSYKTAGIFAFAWDVTSRHNNPNTEALLNHVVYSAPAALAFGGGIRDLEIEGLGVPQGIGFYFNTTSTPAAPAGYFETTAFSNCLTASPYVCIPISGSVVEIDSAKEAFFDNLAIYDAYGEGNAMFQAGVNDGDPTNFLGTDFGSIFMSSDRFGMNYNQYGVLDPEFAVNLQSAHDSQFSNFVAFDGTEADVYEAKGNIYDGLHVESDVLNRQTGVSGPQAINWTPGGVPIGPLAGMASYGLESSKHAVLSNMQCDNVWNACLLLNTAGSVGDPDSPSAVTNVAVKCGGFVNVWPAYDGVELAAGAQGVAVSNVAASPICGFTNTQLVHYDSPIVDASVQVLSQSPTSQFCTPSLGFQSGRYYTTPYTSAGGQAISANTLYAIPVQIACTVTVAQLSTYVTTAVTGVCEYGIYGNNGKGQPGALILDAGHVSVGVAMGRPITGLSQQLSPGLVFLVVGCNVGPGLQSGVTPGSLPGGPIGLTTQIDTSEVEESAPGSWDYSSTGGLLPSTFPTVQYAAASSPLVFLTPP